MLAATRCTERCHPQRPSQSQKNNVLKSEDSSADTLKRCARNPSHGSFRAGNTTLQNQLHFPWNLLFSKNFPSEDTLPRLKRAFLRILSIEPPTSPRYHSITRIKFNTNHPPLSHVVHMRANMGGAFYPTVTLDLILPQFTRAQVGERQPNHINSNKDGPTRLRKALDLSPIQRQPPAPSAAAPKEEGPANTQIVHVTRESRIAMGVKQQLQFCRHTPTLACQTKRVVAA